MSYIAAIYQDARPDRLDELLGTIARSLAESRTVHPGRRNTRLFQRLGEPTRLLSLSQWTDGDAFEQFRRWPVFVDTCATCTVETTIEPLLLLRHFERMEQRAAIAACATVTAPPDRAVEVEELLLSTDHEQIARAEGLVGREVYRSRERQGRFLLLHRWRSLVDLDRFRAAGSLEGAATLVALGASTTRFTGALAAEFSAYDGLTGATTAR